MIRGHEGQHSVALMCRVLEVSRSGYYASRSRGSSERQQANEQLTADIRRIYGEHKGRCGAPRITVELRSRPAGKNRVARLMRADALRAKGGPQVQGYDQLQPQPGGG